MFTIITAVLGITSTIIAWKLNPRRVMYAELDRIYTELDKFYQERDHALETNDIDTLTLVTAAIVRLRTRKGILLQRLGSSV